MKILTLTRFSLAVALGATACGKKSDDDSGGDAGDTEAGTTGDPEPEEDTTGSTGDDAEGDEESTGDEPTEIMYAGLLEDFNPLNPMVIAGAVITALEDASVEALSDDDGSWEIGPLPVDPPPILLVEPSDDYFGTVRPVRPAELSMADDLQLGQVSRADIEDQISGLASQEPAEPDLEQSIIIVRLLNLQASGATVELDPPPEEGTYYAPNSQGNQTLNSNVMEFPLFPVVIFFNVEPKDAGEYVLTASHPERECTVPRPDFPTLAGHITLVEVSCPGS